MHVIALGGAGAMGRVAATHLARHPAVTRITVADRDRDAADALAAELGPIAAAAAVDVADPVSLAAVLDGTDLVVNTTGPYYRFGVTVLDAAIAAGAHYVDICDDPAPTLAMLDRHDAAVAAGVVALVGMGASPGASNVLARLAADRLDRVERILTAWPEDPTADELPPSDAPSAASIHWVHQCAHPITVLVDGELRDVQPLEAIEIDYPGVGRGTVVTVGHPEAVTLHRAVPGLRESRNAMVITPALHDELRAAAAEVAAGASDREAAASLLRRLRDVDLGARGPAAPFGWLLALAEGEVGGRRASVAAGLTAYPAGGMAGATGVPLAIGAGMLLDGTIAAPGVHPPEVVVPAERFIAELALHCVAPDGTTGVPADALVLVTSSGG